MARLIQRLIAAVMRVVIYIRVSTEMQTDGYSMGEQEKFCREFAAARGWEVVHVYVDEAESAKTDDRPQFQQMIHDAELGRFDAIIVTRFDRFARNRRDTENYLYDLDQLGVEVYSAREQIDRQSASGKAYLGMISTFNQFYSDQLSENVTVAKAARVKKDKLWNSAVPFGYAVHYKKDGGDGIPYPDPEAADGVRLAYERYATGMYSYNDIADVLNKAGYRPVGRGTRALKLFSKDTVEDILQNRFYLGEVSYKGTWYAGAHEAILTPELFDRCQEARQRRARKFGTTACRDSRVYVLSGIVRCARCGGNMRGTYSQSANCRYYFDPSRQRGGLCNQRQVRADAAEDMLGAFLHGLHLPDDWRDQILQLVQNEYGNIRDLERERQRLETQLKRLGQLFVLDEIGEKEFLQQREQLRTQLSMLKPPELPNLERAAALLQNLGQLWQAAEPAERKQIAHTLLKAVYIDAHGNPILAIEPRNEFATLVGLCQDTVSVGQGIKIVSPGTRLTQVCEMLADQTQIR
jgi:DNA invertase Pin-like site-specific DNA recombinase